MKELKLTAYNRHEATPEELVESINRRCGIRNPFFFGGRPFTSATLVEVEENNVQILFRFTAHSDGMNQTICDCWDEPKGKAHIKADDLIGWEMVDAYDGKRYVGTYINVVTK